MDKARLEETTLRDDIAATPNLSKKRLKLWIRLLGVTRRTERALREMLRVEHDTTLPRFDVLAALWRQRDGLTMSDLSAMLLVSGGNTTVVVNALAKEGLVKRVPFSADRRTVYVILTERGLAEFERMAARHETELDALLGKLTENDIDTISTILKRVAQEGEGETARKGLS